jgi:hypothetical protein
MSEVDAVEDERLEHILAGQHLVQDANFEQRRLLHQDGFRAENELESCPGPDSRHLRRGLSLLLAHGGKRLAAHPCDLDVRRRERSHTLRYQVEALLHDR